MPSPIDTPPAEAGRCSVPRRSLRHDSPKGLPGPLDVSGRMLVAVQHQSTAWADMGAHRETRAHALPTARTVLGGVRRRDGFHSLASPCCLAGEDDTEGVPSGV